MQKKLDPDDKTNFRTVNLSLLFSKVFENVIYDQGNEYVDKFLNKSLCGFRKATKHALFRLPQKTSERVKIVWNCRSDSNGFI